MFMNWTLLVMQIKFALNFFLQTATTHNFGSGCVQGNQP